MANGKTDFWLWGLLIGAISALYGFFLKHVYCHVRSSDIEQLMAKMQTKDNCSEIVKRMEANHDQTCQKLDRIMDRLDGFWKEFSFRSGGGPKP